MSSSLSVGEIVQLSGIPKRTVERVLAHFKHDGAVAHPKPLPRLLGAPQLLSQENIQVSIHF